MPARRSRRCDDSRLRSGKRADGRGRSLHAIISEIMPKLTGLITYFRLAEVEGIFEELDGWFAAGTAVHSAATVEASLYPS